jgi:hypothetical protein
MLANRVFLFYNIITTNRVPKLREYVVKWRKLSER